MMLLPDRLCLASIFTVFFLARTGDGRLGDECWSDVMCNSIAGVCVDDRCECRPPKIPNQSNTDCVVAVDGICQTTTDKCYDPNQSCARTSPTYWDPTVCICNGNFTQKEPGELCRIKMGKKCDGVETPCVDGSCIEGTCQCPTGLVSSPTANNCALPFGATCDPARPNCVDPNAYCNADEKTCECKPEIYQPSENEDGITYCKAALGAVCENDDKCAVLNSSCEMLNVLNKTCTCIEGFVPSEDRLSCLPVTNSWRGTCQEDLQCSAMFGRFGICKNRVCSCANGYAYVEEDFGCVPDHVAVSGRTAGHGIKLLATTLLPYLPDEAKIAVEQILDVI
ncbi:multiple epidermal growth factor-like domains protein 10 isoform X2 [Athalia rosae]|uniref:multiple epidermal growth factor-like domains protein 10 isoform X2 n=1 Tax=Athalia rosae TaxID=37344 RepID=UPI0020337CC6|nr:multiple epidermal growth factor-like domains protein 10 isoform X2 [Athalia rosae]